MNYICTWFCADEKGEESIFPQTGQKSSGERHQHIYWRCLILYYTTSRRFNLKEKHLLFTNVKKLPFVDGRNVAELLNDLKVEVIFTGFNYKTPKGYFGMFQNQFYEFSILEYIAKNGKDDDNYLITDSDCIFIKPAAALFEQSKVQGFLSFEDDCTTELVIHGLSRMDMKALYEELLHKEMTDIPGYHLGEFLLASVQNIKTLFAGFLELWPELLRRNQNNLKKFNEEAQTLSYLYYKNGFVASPRRDLMKRVWTNPVFYRDVADTDPQLILWHLPAEKTYGLAALYRILVQQYPNYSLGLPNESFLAVVEKELGIPNLTPTGKLKYYTHSYARAGWKRLKKAIKL